MDAAVHFSAVRNEAGHIDIGFPPSWNNAALYWTRENEATTAARHLITDCAQTPLTVSDPLNARERVYFILELGDKKWLFAERTLPISGINNFRDLGGYTGANGRAIKWGLLYRSNHLHNLTAQAKTYLEGLHIQSIIDYRSAREIAKSPNCCIHERATFHLDATAQTAELAAQFAAEPSHEDTALIESVMRDIPAHLINGEGAQVLEQYRHFVTSEKSKTAFRAMITALLDPVNIPNIQHCRGGKDRTGYGVLLILAMLGVSEQDIIRDYMITQQNRRARNAVKMAAYRQITDNQNVLDYLHTLVDTRESFITEAIETMKSQSGSVAAYIKDELGFTDADFKTLQDNFLIAPA